MGILISTHCGKLEITAGAFWRAQPDTVSYEATVPIVYESIWLEKQNFDKVNNPCGNDTWECGLLKNITSLQNAYINDFQNLEKSWSPKYLKNYSSQHESTFIRKRSLDFLGEGLAWCCGVATQHNLDSIVMNENDLQNKISKLTSSFTSSIRLIGNNSKKFNDFQKQSASSFNVIEEHIHILEKHFNTMKDSINKQYMEHTNAANTILENQFINLKNIIRLSDAIKKQSILASCRQHHTPSILLDPEILSHDLLKLQNELSSFNQQLAIPISELAKYYQLPLCDCSFLNEKIIIHIRIPVRQKFNYWKLYHLITTPFAWYNQTCKIHHDNLFLAVNNNPKSTQIRQISGINLRHCRPLEDKLCFLPRFPANSLQSPICAKKLFDGASVSEISHHCPMSCHKSTATIISEIEEEIYIITHAKAPTLIKCPNSTTEFSKESYETPGAIKLYLPCNCKLFIQDEEVIPSRFPCSENYPLSATMHHIIPASWSNLQSFVLNPLLKSNQPVFQNSSEALNVNWTSHIPHLNLTSDEDTIAKIMENINTIYPDTYNYGGYTYGVHNDSIFLIWNIILSILVIFLLMKLNNATVVAAIPVAPAHGKEFLNNKFSYDIIFIIICVCLAVFILYLCYHIVNKFCYKNKRTSKTKKTKNTESNNDIELETFPKKLKTMKFVLEINDETEITKLSPGERLNATIYCQETN